MILQIHDELIVEAPEEEREAVEQILKTAMESVSDVLPGGGGAPLLTAGLQSGKSWYECK